MIKPHWLTLLALLMGLTWQTRTLRADAPRWHNDYRQAWNEAQKSQKQLFILFTDGRPDAMSGAVDRLIRQDVNVQQQLENFVVARLPIDTVISVKGQPVELLQHAAFAELHGREGIAIVDLANPGEDYYQHVVSAFPFANFKYYRFRADYLPIILSLPHGTITQRTMIWAVRIHPESPRSTEGKRSTVLISAAKEHSQHQATIGVQGHHRWESRFHILRRLLGGSRVPVEVVAESWPNQNLVDSCIDCVASWRQSSGHWNAVKSSHASYGYDIKRGRNGIWYGTGIFSN